MENTTYSWWESPESCTLKEGSNFVKDDQSFMSKMTFLILGLLAVGALV